MYRERWRDGGRYLGCWSLFCYEVDDLIPTPFNKNKYVATSIHQKYQ